MLILKSQLFSDEALIEYAATLSSKTGKLKEKLLHWDFGPLMNMSYDQEAQNYLFSDEAVPFHWDGAFFKEPRLLLFYCTQSEGHGGETIFTDTEKIWESLSLSEQEKIKKITLKYQTKKLAHYGGEITLPLVQQHPITGKTILRMAEAVNTQLNPVSLEITGIENAHDFYLSMVEKMYHPEFMYQHSWNKGDLVLCDNYTYLHGRRPLGLNRKRAFKRIQIL